MENTYLRIGTRIVEIEWTRKFTYNDENFREWYKLTAQEETLQLIKLEAEQCSVQLVPGRINITETRPIEATKVRPTTGLTYHEWKKINDHVTRNPEIIPAKSAYLELAEMEIY